MIHMIIDNKIINEDIWEMRKIYYINILTDLIENDHFKNVHAIVI